MEMNNPHVLGEAPIGKLLWQYSIPAIIGMTLTSLYNIIDSIFIGHGVGALAITALAITFPLMNLLIAFSTLVGVGGATLSSIRLGQKDQHGAEDILGNVTVMCVVNAVVFGSISLIFLDPILYFFGATDATIGYAHDFMEVILLGTPISYVMIGLNNVMRATGYPKKAMLSSMLTVGCNIVFAPLFIFWFGWGIRGAAIATILSQFIGMIWVLYHFCDKKSYIRFKRRCFHLKRKIIGNVFAIGMSPFVMNVCACGITIFINNSLLTYGGDLSIGAFGILNRIQMLFVMIVMGITMGMQPITGYNYGAQLFSRVKHTLKLGMIAATLITVFGFLVGEIFPKMFVGMFTTNDELTEQATVALRFGVAAFPVVGAQVVITQFFQSIGKAKISIFLSLSRQLLFLLPGLALLPLAYNLNGVWLSMPVSDFLAYAVAAWMLVYHYRHKMKEPSSQPGVS